MRTHRVALVLMWAFILSTSGCADKKSRLLSTNIPLNTYDLEEVRSGVDAHKALKQDSKFIEDEIINKYLTSVGRKLAQASERPFLPWQFYILDEDKCEAYALPGGHIYISAGLFSFIESEAELAAVIAHEVGHTSAYRYQSRETSRKIKLGRAAKFGAGAAGGFLGPAGGAASSIISGIEVSSPYIKQQFSKDAEAEADGRAMVYLSKLDYPPEAIVKYNERLSATPIDDLPQFIHFFNAHPPSDFRVGKARESLASVKKSFKTAAEVRWGTELHSEMVKRLQKLRKGELPDEMKEKKSLIDIVLDKSSAESGADAKKNASPDLIQSRV